LIEQNIYFSPLSSAVATHNKQFPPKMAWIKFVSSLLLICLFNPLNFYTVGRAELLPEVASGAVSREDTNDFFAWNNKRQMKGSKGKGGKSGKGKGGKSGKGKGGKSGKGKGGKGKGVWIGSYWYPKSKSKGKGKGGKGKGGKGKGGKGHGWGW
jgi:hypothetical protein